MLQFILLLIPCVYGLEEQPFHTLTLGQYLLYSGVSLMLVIIAGIMSGLTVGLMSIDEIELKLKLANGTDEEKRQAFRVLKILKNHHLLLVTLLIANATAMETLPLVLDRMFSQVIAVIISVTFVLILGEVIPQAICTGPNQIKIASKMVPVVKVVICIYFLIAWPIAKCLDYCFGKKHHKSDNLKLENLKTLIELHTSGEITLPAIEKINTGQTKIIHGAINITKLMLSHHMNTFDSSMIISYDLVINLGTVRKLQSTGYDQLLVHAIDQPRKIIGVFNTKDLCICKIDASLLQSEVSLGAPIFLQQDCTLFDALNLLEKRGAEWVCVVSNDEEVNDMGEDLLQSDSPDILGVISINYILDILMKDNSTEVNIEEQSQIFIKVIQRSSVDDPQIIVNKLEQLNPNDWDKQTDNGAIEKISENPRRKLGLPSDSIFAFV